MQDFRKKLAYEIEGIAHYYSRKLDPQVLSMYVDDLIDLPLNAVIEAYRRYRRDQKNRTMPLPAQIRDIVQPASSPESEAREAAAKITQAIVTFGYSNGSDARILLGEKAWSVVQSFGGWNYLCTNHGGSINPVTFYAQVRERMTDVVRETPRFNQLEISGPNDEPPRSIGLKAVREK